jgi:hypothetical protein
MLLTCIRDVLDSNLLTAYVRSDRRLLLNACVISDRRLLLNAYVISDRRLFLNACVISDRRFSLLMEAAGSSSKLASVYQTARRHIREHSVSSLIVSFRINDFATITQYCFRKTT